MYWDGAIGGISNIKSLRSSAPLHSGCGSSAAIAAASSLFTTPPSTLSLVRRFDSAASPPSSCMDSSPATTTSSSSSGYSSTTCDSPKALHFDAVSTPRSSTTQSPASARQETGSAPNSEITYWSISSSDDDTGGDTPINAVFCIKRKEDIRRFEEKEDCFILDFDPWDEVDIRKISLESENFDQNGIAIVAEKGQVACRDYPHSRHLCQKFPFATTPHDNYCDKCYCYVCDAAAPCSYWTLPGSSHCDATGNSLWETKRKLHQMLNLKVPDRIG